MGDDVGGWIFFAIYLVIALITWMVRRGKRKPNTPAQPRQDLPPNTPLSSDPSEAIRRHLARAKESPVSIAPQPNPFAGDPVRAPIYNQLNLRDTQDLLREWHDDDATHWSDAAFDVMERILVDRLGGPPTREEEAESPDEAAPELDEDVDPGVKLLWAHADREGLAVLLQYSPDWLIRMDAAEALASLEDPRGVQYLIAALADPSEDVRTVAREILEGLGTGPAKPSAAPDESELPAQPAAPEPEPFPEPEGQDAQGPVSPGDVWAAYRKKQKVFESEQMAKAPGGDRRESATMESLVTVNPASTRAGCLRPYLLVGAVGGILGLAGSYLLLAIFGAELAPFLPSVDPTQQLNTALIVVDFVVGAFAGAIGNRFGLGLASRLGFEPSDRDAVPMISAGLAGVLAALVVNAVLSALSGA